MPVFEYLCSACGERYEIFHPIKEKKEDIICPRCESINYEKLFSQFSASINNSKASNPLPADCSTCSYGSACRLN